jgi:endo-1,4-beta-xylanase
VRRLITATALSVALPTALVSVSTLSPAAHDAAQAASDHCSTRPYPDVPTQSTFCKDIRWLKGQGITRGYQDRGYHPAASVTRQAMAAYLYRLSNPGKTAPACTSKPYNDVQKSDTFCGDINWLKGKHITTGYNDGGYHPAAPVTRRAMAAYLHRLSGVQA